MSNVSRIENARRASLQRARQANRNIQNAQSVQNNREDEGPGGFDLGKDYPLLIALFFAIFKDVLDLVGIGSFPVIGWVVTGMVSIIIAMMMFLAGASEKKKIARAAAKRIAVLCIGTGIETIFTGINILPIETLTVVIIIVLTIAERKKLFKVPGEKNFSSAKVYSIDRRRNQLRDDSGESYDYKKAA